MDNLEIETKADAISESFDIVERQDAHDAAIAALRSEVEEVKGRIERAGRMAVRPMLAGGTEGGAGAQGLHRWLCPPRARDRAEGAFGHGGG